jgi:exoribonuclease-2
LNQVLFEENGDFKAGTILADAGTSLQVELASGRRAKIKSSHILLRFDTPAASRLMDDARTIAETLDVGFLWDCAPAEEFGFVDLATDYFGARPTASQSTAMLLTLFGSPIHFQRKGRGRFRPAPAETVTAALAGLERRKQQEMRIEALASEMVEGRLPDEIARQAAALLVRPDRSSIEFRALDLALRSTQGNADQLLMRLGAFRSSVDLHLQRFTSEFFPLGTGFDARVEAARPDPEDFQALPLADALAFSIDDSSTTEIDDALSVQARAEGGWRIGIHIAAPALGIRPDSRLDEIARDRMSSVYMPGDKITMLPAGLVNSFSLDQGRTVPAVSLYIDLAADGESVERHHSCVERVRIVTNLRHDQDGERYTEHVLDDPMVAAALPHGDALAVLWRLTLASVRQRERVRGKPEPRFRADFSFRIDRTGETERVEIVQRRRDAPLDRIVAEMMILANSLWGQLLAEHQVTGIYRSQQAGRVRMSTQALEHEGIGVPQYIWSTSPLRRYVDLVNQRQLVALLTGERPHHAPKDASIFSIIGGFETRHAAYQDFQQRMERLWCLRWVGQEGLRQTEAVVIREDLIRLASAPLYFRIPGLPALPAGRPIQIEIDHFDEIDLSISARFLGTASASTPTVEGEAFDASGSEAPQFSEPDAAAFTPPTPPEVLS